MRVNLAYGQGQLPVEFPDGRTTVIEPTHAPGLPDERAAIVEALEQPIGALPLRAVDQAGAPRLHRLHRHHARHAQRADHSLAAGSTWRTCPATTSPCSTSPARTAPTPAPNWSGC